MWCVSSSKTENYGINTLNNIIMKKLHLLKTVFLLCALVVGSMNGWGAEVIHYTLDGTNTTSGGNSNYAQTGNDVVQNEMHWSAIVNATNNPWRIGGKSISGVDRTIQSKTAMGAAISKVTVEVGAASNITVNSFKLIVASDASFETQIDEVSKTFSANSIITFTPTSGTEWATGAYYKIIFNVTVSIDSNKFVEFKNAKFYKFSTDVPISNISLPSTADVPVGKTRTLTATVTPDNHTGTVDWESDNTSIATVTSAGVVTGVAAGSTTIRAKSHADNTIAAECTITVNEDEATLPFIWAGGSTSSLTALYGVTGNSLGDYVDNASNRPYLVQFNAVGDYIKIRTDGQPGIVNIGIKMLGGSTTSKIKIQESADGSEFTDVDELTISGNQNDVVNLVTTTAFKSASRYVRIYKSVHNTGGNIGVGPINISLPGEPSIPVVSGSTLIVTTSTNMAGWRAFYDASKDYSVDANTKVYVADADPVGTTITLKSIEGIPAGKPVILHTSSSADSYKMTLTEVADGTYTYTGTNKLIWATSAVDNKYRLGFGASGVGFYPYSGTPSTGAVILDVSSAGARELTINFEDEGVTGVNELKVQKADNQFFNLAGQRVAQPTKGLYIVNGKKVIVK